MELFFPGLSHNWRTEYDVNSRQLYLYSCQAWTLVCLELHPFLLCTSHHAGKHNNPWISQCSLRWLHSVVRRYKTWSSPETVIKLEKSVLAIKEWPNKIGWCLRQPDSDSVCYIKIQNHLTAMSCNVGESLHHLPLINCWTNYSLFTTLQPDWQATKRST